MNALSTLNPTDYPIIKFRTLLSSAALQLNSSSACFTGTIWREKRTRCLPLKNECRRRQISKVIHDGSKVSSLDVLQESDEADSTTKDLEVVMKTIEDYVANVKERLNTMGGARVSVSPYDTAYVTLIKDINGHGRPQFPSGLEWIAQNQLPDGSWGDQDFFIASDRLQNTLACVIALRTWNVHLDKMEKGISFIKENVHKLETANVEHANCGFEIVFPALLSKAEKLGIDLPYDVPVITEIYTARDRKLKRIPTELVHTVPTTLLFSIEGLEGFEDLDWKRLLKLQKNDGSIFTSPAATAFAYMETKDENCLKFIDNLVQKFTGAVPHSYPIDLLARLWAVDRLQRLGISRYIQPEIKDLLDYVYRYWNTEKGIFSASNAGLTDVDDTAMAFRLFRMNGYKVSPDVFEYFRVGDKFSCFGGQMIESESPIFALNRASQFLYPGEKILEETKEFSYKFLQESLTRDPLLDKWVISKDLPDEIRYGLEMPWYSSLPRVEARSYLGQYSGDHELWNGKSWFRLSDVGNNTFLEFAMLDFNRCQEQHQIEWNSIQEWYHNNSIQEFGISSKDLLLAFFLASASIFEPTERSKERIVWAKSQIISKMITSFFNNESISWDQKVGLLAGFLNNKNNARDTTNRDNTAQGHIDIILNALGELLEGFEENIKRQLINAWGEWLVKLYQGTTDSQENAELHANILNICAGHISEDILSHPEYKILSQLTNKICHQLEKVREKSDLTATTPNNKIEEIERDMQALVQLVLEASGGIDQNIKQTFLMIAKTYYYSAYVAAEKTEIHISEVLFEPVV